MAICFKYAPMPTTSEPGKKPDIKTMPVFAPYFNEADDIVYMNINGTLYKLQLEKVTSDD